MDCHTTGDTATLPCPGAVANREMHFVVFLARNAIAIALDVAIDDGLQNIQRSYGNAFHGDRIVARAEAGLDQPHPGFVIPLGERKLPSEFAKALFGDTFRKRYSQRLRVLRMDEGGGAPGCRQVERLLAAELWNVLQFSLEELPTGIGVFRENRG